MGKDCRSESVLRSNWMGDQEFDVRVLEILKGDLQTLRKGIFMKIGQKHGFVFALLSFWIGSSVAASPVDPFEVLFENSSEVPTFQLVDSAHKSLDIEIYQISDLVIQSKILEALKRGVKVRIIQESETVGSRCPVFEPLETQDSFSCRLEKSFVQDIQKAGGEYVPYRSDVFCPPGDGIAAYSMARCYWRMEKK